MCLVRALLMLFRQLDLKNMKAAQHEAELAKHETREQMRQLMAKNERRVQEATWRQSMAFREREEAAEYHAMMSAKYRFHKHRSALRSANAADEDSFKSARSDRPGSPGSSGRATPPPESPLAPPSPASEETPPPTPPGKAAASPKAAASAAEEVLHV